MHKRDLVAEMVTSAKLAMTELGYEGKKTVSVKIRIHKDLRETVDFVKTVQEAGVDFITIHGRTRSTASSVPVNLDAIKLLREHCQVPTLANGDVFSLADAFRITKETGVDGVMSARGLLENPGLFKPSTPGKLGCEWETVETFMRYVMRAPLPFKLVLHHLSEMVGSDHTQAGSTLFTKEERMKLMDW
jgi:tRNA-dihydrouridine synthase 4